jgi:hypothetical protein
MGTIGKTSALILTLIVAMSCLTLLTVKPVNAQTIPKPSVPEFSLKYVKASYIKVDQYTGASKEVDNSTIEVTIKNQPFSPQFYTSANTNTSLFYNIQVKGHYADNWTEVYNSYNYSYPLGTTVYTFYDYPVQSNSEYTTLSLPANYPANSKVDFRLQAIIANETEILIPNFLPDNGQRYHPPSDYTQEVVWTTVFPSDWSNIETLNLADGSVSTTSSAPTSTPTVPEFPALAIFPLFVIVLSVAVILRQRKTTNIRQ